MTTSSIRAERTQVGIVGAGPAGLLLSHLLALRGIDSVLVESRSQAYCEARQRAGLLEDGTVRLLRATGLGERLDAEGLPHGGIYLQFAGERHHLDFRDLAGPRTKDRHHGIGNHFSLKASTPVGRSGVLGRGRNVHRLFGSR